MISSGIFDRERGNWLGGVGRDRSRRSREAGFTRLDVIVLCVCLGGVFLFARAGGTMTQSRGHAIQCMSNLRQLAAALQVYALDHDGYLPGNDEGAGISGRNWCQGVMANLADATNVTLLVGSSGAVLGPYTRDITIYRCPDDVSTAVIGGRVYPRVRSYSLNGTIGTKVTPGWARLSVDGPWLDGKHSHLANRTWRTYGRLADMTEPAPKDLFCFIDEDPVSINECVFGVAMTQPEEWVDWPAQNHDARGCLSYADGHVEQHRWEDARTRIIGSSISYPTAQPGNPDIVWLQGRTIALIRR